MELTWLFSWSCACRTLLAPPRNATQGCGHSTTHISKLTQYRGSHLGLHRLRQQGGYPLSNSLLHTKQMVRPAHSYKQMNSFKPTAMYRPRMPVRPHRHCRQSAGYLGTQTGHVDGKLAPLLSLPILYFLLCLVTAQRLQLRRRVLVPQHPEITMCQCIALH